MRILIRTLTLIPLLSLTQLTDSCQPIFEVSHPLKIDGSSTVFTISEAVAEEFIKQNPGNRLTIGISGTGGGFKKFARGEISIANASRKIKDLEATMCNKNGVEYLEIPVAFDGLAMITNLKNDWLTEITIEELKKLWEPDAQGRIMYWNDIRPMYPHKPIRLYGPGTASGTFDYFTEVIVGESGASRGDYMPSEDDHVLIQGVAGDAYSLGFVGLAYYEENIERIKLVPVDSGNGPIIPTKESILQGHYQPLTRKIYIYVSSKISEIDHGTDFVTYFLKNINRLAEDVGFVPLSDSEYDEQLKRFMSFIRLN